MADQEYKVRDPSGHDRVIRGPAGATDEQIIAQAKNLFSADVPIDLQAMQQRTREHRAMERQTASDPISRDAQETSQEGKLPTWLAGAPGATYPQRVMATPGAQFATGAAAPFVGAGQLAANATGVGKDFANNTVQTGAEMAQAGGADGFNPFNFAGQVLSPANLALARGLSPAVTAPGRIAQGAAVGAASGLTAPVANAADYWGQKGAQTAAGAVGGAAVPTAGMLADFLLGQGSRRVMQSAIKPSTAEPREKVERAITTRLSGGPNGLGFNATPGGQEAIRDLGNAANAESSAIIAPSVAELSGPAMTSRANTWATNRAMSLGEPQDALAQVGRTMQNFENHPAIGDFDRIPIQQAQVLKQGFQRQLRDDYGMPGTSGTVDARKALAYELRREIERAEPGVIEPNRRASEYFNAANVTQRYMNASGNNNPMGSFAPIAAAASGHIGPAAVVMAERSALVRSLLARAMHQGNRAVQPVANSRAAALAAAIAARQRQEE